jgi:signal transduction histidine kinase
VIRHAGNAAAVVELDASDAELRFSVADEGPGFDLGVTARGMGMQIMQDRLDALDGELAIRSAPGRGSAVAGTIPLRSMVPAR